MMSSEFYAEMNWHVLQCHPFFTHHQVKQVRSGIYRRKESIALCYEVTGNLDSIRIPTLQPPVRHDELWRHTCAELFAASEQNTEYAEFNFSPSSHWAAYSFLGYRQGLAPLDVVPPTITQEKSDLMFRLSVDMMLPDLYREQAIRVGLCMVIENIDGACSYWALQHDSPRPDFHRRENWSYLI